MKVQGKTGAAASRNSSRSRKRKLPRLATRRTSSGEMRFTAMEHLTGILAHELRQPLSVIQILASHLRRSGSWADRRVSDQLELLEQQAELAGQILSNLVSLARSGRPQKAPSDLHRILGNALKRISWLPEIRLKRNLAPRLPAASADPLHVDLILFNLISNGLESMKGPGTLSIATCTDGEKILLQITDTGCGIPPGRARKLFQPFVTTKSNGTGLGLALCRQLAEANGGSLVFKSRLGKGTTFELRLPQA
ncbi:MAG: HAMP domain-containing histidine kinase [Acidobacteria bacterium]|nr:HAMP domain-containing histidine kinase [Acidobacteriota bacterium]